MAMTLTQGNLYSQNKLHRGIVDELIKESPVLGRLPFISIVGNALSIGREDESNVPSVSFRQVGGTWTEDTGDIEQFPFALKILGSDADVDNFLKTTRAKIADLMATQVMMKTKQMAHKFERTFIYGNKSGSNEFDGMHALVTSGQTINQGSSTTGAALDVNNLDKLCDTIRGGKPDMLLMNREIRRRITTKLRSVGSYETQRDDYGNFWTVWNDIPILTSDFIGQVETISGSTYALEVGGACSTIFAIRFGEGDGLVGIQNGSIQTEVWDKLETKDACRTRLKWYLGLALYSTKAVAAIDGITDAAMS